MQTLLKLLGLVVLLAGCSQAPPWANEDGPLIVITVDTLRADHLSCYGYTALSTPNFDRLAEEGALFLDASTTMPMTLPAHASIMTGLVPPVHGVRDNKSYFVPEEARTLAEAFTAAGFPTAAFVSSLVLDGIFGLAQGFSHYSLPDRSGLDLEQGLDKQKDATQVTEEAIRWIRDVSTERFFVWIHYFDPHTYYHPPPEFLPAGRHPYDGEIAYVDDRLGRLFQALKSLDLYDQATIVVLSDHGEGLGDHGEASHGFLTYQPTVRIPLIIKSPGIETRRVTAPVSCTDLYPTLTELMHIDEPPRDLDGRSLVALLFESKRPDHGTIYFESYIPTITLDWAGQRGVRLGALKLIESSTTELYDIARDPLERTNLLDRNPEGAKQLEILLAQYRASMRKRRLTGKAAAEDAKHREELLALGYIGGARRAEDDLERLEGRVNPSDRVLDYENFLSAYLEGRVKEFGGDLEGALRLYERAARTGPTYMNIGDVLNSAARCALALGRIAEAEHHAREALEKDPGFLPSLLTLGQAADARGDRETADGFYAECFGKAEKKGTSPPGTSAEIRRRAMDRLNRSSSADRRP